MTTSQPSASTLAFPATATSAPRSAKPTAARLRNSGSPFCGVKNLQQVAKDFDSDPLLLGGLLGIPELQGFDSEFRFREIQGGMSWRKELVRLAISSSTKTQLRSRSAAKRSKCAARSARRS